MPPAESPAGEAPDQTFWIRLDELQPSQLYISAAKLAEVQAQPFASWAPVPVKLLDGRKVLTDGHTRLAAAHLAGQDRILAVWDTDELDWQAYRICVDWCLQAGVRGAADLAGRVIPGDEYELAWHARCQAMQGDLETARQNMADCIFCAILAGQAPASIVYRDEVCTAFMDIRPVNGGHVLVIPNRHAANLSALDPQDGAHVFRTGQKVAAALRRSGLPCEGVNLFLADGEVAGQEVFHVHLHILPRFSGDGFGLRFGPHYHQPTPRQALDEAAARIKGAL